MRRGRPADTPWLGQARPGSYQVTTATLGTRRRGTQQLTVSLPEVTEARWVTQPPDPRLPDSRQV